jgi:hypothetical protein
MTKHKKVTDADRLEIQRIVDGFNSTDVKTFLLGIEAAQQYLKDNVEERGLFYFASDVLGSRHSSDIEHWVAGPIFLEFSQKEMPADSLDIDPVESAAAADSVQAAGVTSMEVVD